MGNLLFRCVETVTGHSKETVSLNSIRSARIIVGTSCTGTGLDIAGVGHIIVVGLPFSIEQLLQWAGRCRTNGYVTVLVPSTHIQVQQGSEIASKDIALVVFVCEWLCDMSQKS
jgi:superfamily II DNA/RNA helicase